jgi:Uma2 family endonuclease
MSALSEKRKYTPEEYLALEEKADGRSEYLDGVILAMAGGSLNHARITGNVNRFLSANLGENCESLTTDIKIRVENYRRFYYPDVFVLCGEPEFYGNRDDTITNPALIVEVLSDSTEARDRGEKLLAYRSLDSLREYVLISQNKPIVEQYARDDKGNWLHRATIGLKSVVKFESVGVELSLEEIYRRIKFEEE